MSLPIDDRAVEEIRSRHDAGEGEDERPDAGADEADDDEHRQALDRLRVSVDAYTKQCERERAALMLQVPDLHWSKGDRDARAGDTINGIKIAARPTVSIPKIDQSIQLILNQERAAHLGVKVEPADERGNDETADVQTGMYRQIERESRAGLARSWAFERAVKAGRGAWQVVTVPCANYAETKDQDIRIKRILYQDAVHLDPFALEPDWSDGEWGHVLEWMAFSKYKRLFKKIKKRPAAGITPNIQAEDMPSLLAMYGQSELIGFQQQTPEWIKGDGEARAILISTYMFMESRPASRAEARAKGWKKGEVRRVQWRQMNGVEFMDYGVIHSAFIPIVPAIGRELIPFDDERRWMGMYEPNADAQRVFNYAASTAVENMAQEPRNTWVMAEGQEEGHEKEFLLANVKNFPYVRYKVKEVNGVLVPPPMRQQTDTSKLGMSIQVLGMSGDWLHAGTSTYEPSLGDHSPNVKTKGGTLALQAQSEQANSNWMDNHGEISMTLEAKIVLSMLPFYYDRPGRVARILGAEDKDARTVMLNRPFVTQNGKPQGLPYGTADERAIADQQVADPEHPAKRYDLLAGVYNAVVSVGKGYKSRVDQGADELGQLFLAEPELFKLLGDIYLRFRDFPGHEEAADRMHKMLPPQLQKSEDGQDDPKIKLEQAEQALQQMQGQMQQMAQALQTDKVKADAGIEEKRIMARAQYAIALMNSQVEDKKLAIQLEIAKLNNQTKLAIEDKNAAAQAGADAAEHVHSAEQAERDRAIDLALAAAGRAAGLEDGQLEHERGQAAADADHARTLEQQAAAGQEQRTTQAEGAEQDLAAGEQGHTQALEQQQQAADLTPDPAAGTAE